MFSTKRLNKKALGKWGIGSKSGLSTGVESYQMTSRYNGREYKFDIYNDRFFSTVSEINMDTYLLIHTNCGRLKYTQKLERW